MATIFLMNSEKKGVEVIAKGAFTLWLHSLLSISVAQLLQEQWANYSNAKAQISAVSLQPDPSENS